MIYKAAAEVIISSEPAHIVTRNLNTNLLLNETDTIRGTQTVLFSDDFPASGFPRTYYVRVRACVNNERSFFLLIDRRT